MSDNRLKMLTICPTRGRPENAKELAQTWLHTSKYTTHNLVFVVDSDDPQLDKYKEISQGDIYVGVCQRSWLSAYINDYATRGLSYPNCQLIGFVGDDHRFRTYGWDERWFDIVDEYKTGVLYGNDLYQGKNLPTACWLTTDIIRTLGYMCPPSLKHMELDTVWKLWGDEIGCLCYSEDIIIEHMHPVAGKSQSDEGYERVAKLQREDADALHAYLNGAWLTDRSKLRNLVEAR